MSWGSPDHDHSDLSRAIDETRWDAERNVNELRDELYRVKQEVYNDLYGEIAGLREQVRELSGADA